MTGWTRATEGTYCGYCRDKRIAVGDPVFEIGLARLKRCTACAGVPVPADLPALPVRNVVAITPTPKPTRGFRGVGTLVNDWKTRQSGSDQ